jgi:excisionase family DNA binding protein
VLNNNAKATPAPLALRPKDAARALGIGQRTLWTLTKTGAIPAVKVGTCTLYPVDELRAWLTAQTKGAPADD